MLKCAYPAIILHPDKPGALWGVVFPDLPGTVSAGNTLAHATMEAVDALELALSGMEEEGQPLPEPSDLAQARARFLDEGGTEAEIAAVQLIVAALPGRTQRYTITLDSNLVSQIDRISSNRSAFLADAARDALKRRRAEIAREAAFAELS